MPVAIVHRYTRADFHAHPDKLFVFGDNHARQGHGGQAREARGEPNAVGIRTKKAPTYREQDFLSDSDYTLNVTAILEDLQPVFQALRDGKTVVWPADGVGTGIAGLPTRAPETLRFLNTVIDSLMRVYGTTEFQPTERTRP